MGRKKFFRTRISNSGYAQYNTGSGWKYTHRRVAEKKMGGSIYSGYEVHHVNGDKLDNRPSNLRVLSRSEHRAIHRNDYATGGYGSSYSDDYDDDYSDSSYDSYDDDYEDDYDW